MWLHSWPNLACNIVQLQKGENLPIPLAFPQEFVPISFVWLFQIIWLYRELVHCPYQILIFSSGARVIPTYCAAKQFPQLTKT